MIQYTPTSLSLDFINNLAVVNGEDYALNKNQTPARPNAFDNLITFSRGSLGTVTDSTGRVTYAPNNLLLNSQCDTGFVGNGTTPPTVTNSQVWQNISSTKITFTSTNAIGYAGSRAERNTTNNQAGVSAGFFYVGSNYISLSRPLSGTESIEYYWTGVGGFQITTVINSTNSSQYVNQWVRTTSSRTTPMGAAGVNYPVVFLRGALSSNLDVYICNGQCEQVTYQTTPGTYNATTSAAYYGPRFDYDPVTLAPKGLLVEEQRTNLLVRSEEFDNASWAKTRSSITANATTSPDGTVDADKLVEDTTASNTHQVGQTFSATSGTSYSFSVYLKAAERTWAFLQLSTNMFADAAARSAYINLSTGAVGTTAGSPTVTVVDAGGGWWRVTLAAAATATASAGALVYLATGNNGVSYTGNGTSGIFVWGAQLEAGAFATSYIPTVASQVTRNADVCSMTGTNFSSWYNQNQGTFAAQALTMKPTTVSSGSYFLVNASDGTTAQQLNIRFTSTNVGGLVWNGGVLQVGKETSYVTNAVEKYALAFKINDFAFSRNGATPLLAATGTIPIVNRLSIGTNAAASSEQLNGYIRNIQYYPQRLPNAVLQQLTT